VSLPLAQSLGAGDNDKLSGRGSDGNGRLGRAALLDSNVLTVDAPVDYYRIAGLQSRGRLTDRMHLALCIDTGQIFLGNVPGPALRGGVQKYGQ
jgi:hypothetical protein